MRNKLLKPDIYLCLLIGLIAYHLLSNLLWISLSTAPIPWDQAGHTRLAIQFSEYFQSLGILKPINYFSISTYYPPLIHSIVGFFIIIFDRPIETGEIVINLFFGASIFLVFQYAYCLFKSRRTALISAFIYSLLPIIFEHSRWFLLEIPQITFLLLALIFLHKSRNFMDKKNTMYFFIALALAALTKWTSLVYILIPFLISFYHWMKINNEHKNNSINYILKYLLVFFIVTVPWYIINFSTFVSQSLPNLKGESSDPTTLASIQNFTYYIYLLVNFQMTLYVAAIFLVSSIYFFAIKKSDHKLLLGGTILFIYLLFSFISNKDWRYTMPILPFAAIIMGVFLNDLIVKFKYFGYFLLLSLFLFLFSLHGVLSFRPQELSYQKAVKIPVLGWIDYININDSLVHTYNQVLWPQNEILSDLNVDRRKWFLCLVDQERFNCSNLVLEREIMKLIELNIEPPPVSGIDDDSSAYSKLSKFSYVLTVENKIGNPATRNLNIILRLKTAVENSSDFKKIKEYELPNGDRAFLYERQ